MRTAPLATGTDAQDGFWFGTGSSSVVSEDCPELANVAFEITNDLLTGSADEAVPVDADGYEVTAKVQDDQLVDGVLWEEFKAELIAVRAFTGSFSGNQLSGTWYDSYGCSGTYSLARQ